MSRRPALFAALVVATGLAAAPAFAQPATATMTRDFLAAATQSDQFETLEGEVVETQSRNPQVRGFARMMIDDHAGTSAALRRAAEASGLMAPRPHLGGDQQRLLGALQSMTGPAFDKAYAHQQVLAHTEALVVEQGYATSGSDRNVREAARAAVPIIQHHLGMAQQLSDQLGAR